MQRQAELAEKMDDPNCDEVLLLRTVAQFRQLNRIFSRYRTVLRRTVIANMQREPTREYHLVDLGAGGCDIPLWLLRETRRCNLKLRVTAIDNDPRIIAWATEQTRGSGIAVRQMDAFCLDDLKDVDYVIANHFLHHFPDQRVVELLQIADQTAARGIVINDLLRSRFWYILYSVAAPFMFPRSFAWYDGRISIKRGFRPDDLRRLAAQAELNGAQVARFFPGRVIVETVNSKT